MSSERVVKKNTPKEIKSKRGGPPFTAARVNSKLHPAASMVFVRSVGNL